MDSGSEKMKFLIKEMRLSVLALIMTSPFSWPQSALAASDGNTAAKWGGNAVPFSGDTIRSSACSGVTTADAANSLTFKSPTGTMFFQFNQ
jgi:hypothetical protein